MGRDGDGGTRRTLRRRRARRERQRHIQANDKGGDEAMRRASDWCRIISFCVLLWIMGLPNALWQLVIAAVVGTAYVIGELRRVAGGGQSPPVTVPGTVSEMEHEIRRLEHELVSARMAADGWKELYDELSDVAHED